MPKRPFWVFALCCLTFLLPSLVLIRPTLQNRIQAEKLDRRVTMAASWEDVLIFSRREDISYEEILEGLRRNGFSVVTAQFSLSSDQEKNIRDLGFHLLWLWKKEQEPMDLRFLDRVQPQDGIFSLDKETAGYPGQLREVGDFLKEKNVFIPVMEFNEQKGLATLARLSPSSLVRGHSLPSEQMLSAAWGVWRARLVRAVLERNVRFLVLHFAPMFPLKDQFFFFSSLSEEFYRRGFRIGPWEQLHFPAVLARDDDLSKSRFWLIQIIPLLFPVVLVWGIIRFRWNSPGAVYLTSMALTGLAGIVVYGLGSQFELVMGLAHPPGIKVKLVFPLLAVLGLLLTPEEKRAFLNAPVQWKQVLGGGMLLAAMALYLMRSGNSPAVAVPNLETGLRQYLENILVARPRFKEFMIGHPFLIWGLCRFVRNKRKSNFFTDGRLFLLVGTIGPISILNTFHHFHSPLWLGLLRSFNGVWLGALLALPLCALGEAFLKVIFRERPAAL